jgi:flavodoxin
VINLKGVAKKVGVGLVIVVILIFAVMGAVIFDVMSYKATGSQTLQPNGTPEGKALVVYDPGISGAAQDVATIIANQMQAKGHTVDLAGIKSSKAANTSGYDVIVVGGPIYAGKAATSVQEYLKTLKPVGAVVGVFATGDDPDTATDYTLLSKEAAPLPEGSTLQIKAVMKIVDPGADDQQQIADFVNALLS